MTLGGLAGCGSGSRAYGMCESIVAFEWLTWSLLSWTESVIKRESEIPQDGPLGMSSEELFRIVRVARTLQIFSLNHVPLTYGNYA